MFETSSLPQQHLSESSPTQPIVELASTPTVPKGKQTRVNTIEELFQYSGLEQTAQMQSDTPNNLQLPNQSDIIPKSTDSVVPPTSQVETQSRDQIVFTVDAILENPTNYPPLFVSQTMRDFIGGRTLEEFLQDEATRGHIVVEFMKNVINAEKSQVQLILDLTKKLPSEASNIDTQSTNDTTPVVNALNQGENSTIPNSAIDKDHTDPNLSDIQDITPDEVVSVTQNEKKDEIIIETTDGKKQKFNQYMVLLGLLALDATFGGGRGIAMIGQQLGNAAIEEGMFSLGIDPEKVRGAVRKHQFGEQFIKISNTHDTVRMLEEYKKTQDSGNDREAIFGFLSSMSHETLQRLVSGESIPTQKFGGVQLNQTDIQRLIWDNLTDEQLLILDISRFKPSNPATIT